MWCCRVQEDVYENTHGFPPVNAPEAAGSVYNNGDAAQPTEVTEGWTGTALTPGVKSEIRLAQRPARQQCEVSV